MLEHRIHLSTFQLTADNIMTHTFALSSPAHFLPQCPLGPDKESSFDRLISERTCLQSSFDRFISKEHVGNLKITQFGDSDEVITMTDARFAG